MPRVGMDPFKIWTPLGGKSGGSEVGFRKDGGGFQAFRFN